MEYPTGKIHTKLSLMSVKCINILNYGSAFKNAFLSQDYQKNSCIMENFLTPYSWCCTGKVIFKL